MGDLIGAHVRYDDLPAAFQRELIEDYREEAARLLHLASATSGMPDEAPQADYAASLNKAQRDAAEIIGQAKDQAEHIVASAEMRAESDQAAPAVVRPRKSA